MKFKKGQKVIIISGDDKGKKGEVLGVSGNRVKISGVAISTKHQKANPYLNTKSELVKKESFIDASNVAKDE